MAMMMMMMIIANPIQKSICMHYFNGSSANTRWKSVIDEIGVLTGAAEQMKVG